jgi:hypothetical protein
VNDNSYVSVAGCWAASSDVHNVFIDANSAGAVVVIAGGTIFNGGVLTSGNCSAGCNGLTALSGTFQLTGVDVRFNQGRGVWVPQGSSATGFAVTGCRINNNGMGVSLSAGSGYALTGNVFAGNAQASNFGPQQGGAVVANNANPSN